MHQFLELFRGRCWLVAFNLLLTQLLFRVLRRVRIETDEHLSVPQRVLLLHHGALGDLAALDWSEYILDLRAIDKLAEVGLRNNGGWKEEVLLQCRRLSSAAIDGV